MSNWQEFYIQSASSIAAAIFLLIMGWLAKGVWKLSIAVEDLSEFKKETKAKLAMHEERHEVQDNLWSQSLGATVRSDLIAEGKMDYPRWGRKNSPE